MQSSFVLLVNVWGHGNWQRICNLYGSGYVKLLHWLVMDCVINESSHFNYVNSLSLGYNVLGLYIGETWLWKSAS